MADFPNGNTISTLIRPAASNYMNDAGFEGDVVIDRLADAIDLIVYSIGAIGASAVAAQLSQLYATKLNTSASGVANGLAPLAANGRVPIGMLGASPTTGFLRYDGTFADPSSPDPAPVFINPTASAYGAVMDGVTNDSVALQKCFDSFSATSNAGIPVVVVIPQGKVCAFSRQTGQNYGLTLGDCQILKVDGRLKWLAPYAAAFGVNGNAGGISGGMITNRTSGGRTAGRTWKCGVMGEGIIDLQSAAMFAATATGNRVGAAKTADGSNTGTAFTSVVGGLTGKDNHFVVFRSGANAGRAYLITAVASDFACTLTAGPGGVAPANSAAVDWDLYSPDVWDGVRFGSTDDAFVQSVTVLDCFGWQGGPPGETAFVRIYSSADGRCEGVKVTSSAYSSTGVRGTTAATHNNYTGSGVTFSSSVNTMVRNCRVWHIDFHGHAVYHGNSHNVVGFHSYGNGGYDLNWEHTGGTIDNPILGYALDVNGSHAGGYNGKTNSAHPDNAFGSLLLNMQAGNGTQTINVTNPRISGQSRAAIGIHIGGQTVSSVGTTSAVTLASAAQSTSDWGGATAWLMRADSTRLGPLVVQSIAGQTVTFTGAHGASVGETGLSLAVDTFAAINITGGLFDRCTTGIYCLSGGNMAKLRAAELTRIDESVMMVGCTNNFGSMGMGYANTQKQRSQLSPRRVATSITLASDDEMVFVDSASASVTVTLPSPRSATGVPQRITILKLAAANAVTIAANGSALINGAASKVLAAQYEKVELMLVPALPNSAGTGTAIAQWVIVG